ncbi:MAG: fumarylacetoacetate hydrolase family protein, partial [candidate division NC10 bacterium]|nr:fumarylacetoacetate hydrolase family protein [candidate division NC10 bacterium]
LNDRPERANVVGNMAFPPYELVAFHSHVMTLLPGDIISTGTPGAVVIRSGDIVRCEVDGFPALENRVA